MENGRFQVTFNPVVTRFNMYTWDYAYRKARQSNWRQVASDRYRFQRKILKIGRIISSILTAEHRHKIFNKLYASPDNDSNQAMPL